MNDSLEERIQSSWSYAANAEYLYSIYLSYREGLPIETTWEEFFHKNPELTHDEIKAIPSKFRLQSSLSTAQPLAERLLQIEKIFIKDGHRYAQTNPLENLHENPIIQQIKNELRDDWHKPLPSNAQFLGSTSTVGEYIDLLNAIYCNTLSLEAWSLPDHLLEWCRMMLLTLHQDKVEENKEVMLSTLNHLAAADGFERFLATRYPGAKRFSIEGSDALIPLLDELIKHSTLCADAKEIVVGMAHRGRLNVLVNIFGKSPKILFDEFEGNYSPEFGSGDVKYHKGFSSMLAYDQKNVQLSLLFNPSHLEIINPAVTGTVRARQDALSPEQRPSIVPVIIHGDSAFSGQGVNMELLNMSQTRGYRVGGSIHIIINNQIGFTTSDIEDTRSTLYCSDLAKMIDAPILHANGDDPVAVLKAAHFAVEFRKKFQRDIVIDLVCYRRLGHNEADEPAVTQPLMYKKIREHSIPADIFAESLLKKGFIKPNHLDNLKKDIRQKLESGLPLNPKVLNTSTLERAKIWEPYLNRPILNNAVTKVDEKTLVALGQSIIDGLKGVNLHSRVEKIYADRKEMFSGKKALDWGAAETLAYASLVKEGYYVRLTGQDCGRGTFFHRHAVVYDQETGKRINTLDHLPDCKGKFYIYDSLLSEEAVLSFEYGYAGTSPKTVVLWEAQFGDFANGAQVVIDQFIATGLKKWMRHCGMVLLLPHGYEGQGPEHSSARIERFLQLAAQENMRICFPTTPAQIFHLIRLQIHAQDRHPLIIFSPKSFLRNKDAVSDLKLLSQSRFQEVLWHQSYDVAIKKIIFCSGKIFYDLIKKQQDSGRNDILIIRLEQLYPFPLREVMQILTEHNLVNHMVWVQEEPKNQGAWSFILQKFLEILPQGKKIAYVGREESASTATGQTHVHDKEQADILEKAF